MKVEVASSVAGALAAKRVRALVGRIRRALAKSKIQNPASKSELSVLFCGDSRIRTLNRRFRGQDKSTDVLSFPAGEDGLLGDIVVSVPYATRQARRHGDRRTREIERLLVHGYLHLLGYDHETDDGQMAALEAKLQCRLGLREPR